MLIVIASFRDLFNNDLPLVMAHDVFVSIVFVSSANDDVWAANVNNNEIDSTTKLTSSVYRCPQKIVQFK